MSWVKHPSYAVVRWTAPAAGSYQVSGQFAAATSISQPSGADCQFLVNGICQWDQAFTHSQGSASFAGTFDYLQAGDTIDVALGAGTVPWNNWANLSETITEISPVALSVATPVITPNSGGYAAIVNITCTTPHATIMYTTDGSTPTQTHGTALVLGSPILVNQACTVNAVAFATGYSPSPMAQASFTTQTNLLIDSFSYPTSAAVDANWKANGGCPSPTTATINGVPCVDMYMVPGASQMLIDKLVTGSAPLTLPGCTGLTLSMAATNPSEIWYPTFQFWTGSAYYYFADYLYQFGANNPYINIMPANQWTTQFLPYSTYGHIGSGTPSWSDITALYIGWIYLTGSTPVIFIWPIL